MSQPHLQRWHEVVVQRAVIWEDGRDGTAVLLVPRFRKGLFARWLMPRMTRPHIRVRLDEIGSFAWRMMDGATPFNRIAQAMQERFGARAEPAEERLMKFLTILRKDEFVRLLTCA
jgi:Coenzyme PQQ synthesis protein D (PqqD)